MIKYNISHEYEIDSWDEGVYDRKGLDIAWICACLNPLRQRTERIMNLYQKNFKLSPFYILFFHLYDQSCFFIDRIIETRMLPISDAKIKKALTSPVTYSGGWNDFRRIVSNHGVVPLHAMVGGEIHAHRTELLTVLSNCLIYHAKVLRDCADDELVSEREKAVEAVKKILISNLGAPPETFSWNYKTADKEDMSLKDISPVDFYRTYCDYTVDTCKVWFDEVLRGKVPEEKGITGFAKSDWLSRLAIMTLINVKGYQVIVGADTRHQSNKMLGILDTDFCDNESAFGEDVSMSKKDSLEYGRIAVTDYLSLDGFEWDNDAEFPSALRFKAQDSCGADTGADGHYTMSNEWFKKYVLFIVCPDING